MQRDTRYWIGVGLYVTAVGCRPQPDVHAPTTDAPSSKGAPETIGEPTTSAAQGSAKSDPAGNVAGEGAGALQTQSENVDGRSASKPEDGSEAAGSSNAEQPAPSRVRALAEICEKITTRASQTCSAQVAGFYQSSCQYYLKPPGPCEEQLRRALECQYQAADGPFCAHLADHRCSQVNGELKVCQGGTAPADQTAPEDDHTLPAGWGQVQDTELGFTVAMPPGAALDPGSKRRTWKAEEGGISYLVAELEPPPGKLDNQAFVRSVVAYVGARCQRGLRLRGELDLKGTTVVQYYSVCPDKTEWRGMLHFWDGKAVSTGYHAPAGATGVQEPYFYSFQIAK